MNIASLLSPDTVLCKHNTSSKKRIIEDIAEHLSQNHPDIDAHAICTALFAREKLGSTGIGNGIAIPHSRLSTCSHTIAMLITLNKSIDFDAIDNQNVDVVFALLVPEDNDENHLKTLAMIAEKFSDETILAKIRKANSAEKIIEVLKD